MPESVCGYLKCNMLIVMGEIGKESTGRRKNRQSNLIRGPFHCLRWFRNNEDKNFRGNNFCKALLPGFVQRQHLFALVFNSQEKWVPIQLVSLIRPGNTLILYQKMLKNALVLLQKLKKMDAVFQPYPFLLYKLLVNYYLIG